jgi:NTP pyrophosphatase (non-canonical NTP hydrolase)
MEGDAKTTVQHLKDMARDFTNRRDWARFHNPKDLAVAISIEASELLEPFLWKDVSSDDVRTDPKMLERVKEELADVLILSMSLANALGLDVSDLYGTKMERNERKYPVERVKGRSDKYTEYV